MRLGPTFGLQETRQDVDIQAEGQASRKGTRAFNRYDFSAELTHTLPPSLVSLAASLPTRAPHNPRGCICLSTH